MQDLSLEQSLNLCRDSPGILPTLEKFLSWCEAGFLSGGEDSISSDFINKVEKYSEESGMDSPFSLPQHPRGCYKDRIDLISRFSSLCAMEVVGNRVPVEEIPAVLSGWPRPHGKDGLPMGDWEQSYRRVRDQQKDALTQLLNSGKLPPALTASTAMAKG